MCAGVVLPRSCVPVWCCRGGQFAEECGAKFFDIDGTWGLVALFKSSAAAAPKGMRTVSSREL